MENKRNNRAALVFVVTALMLFLSMGWVLWYNEYRNFEKLAAMLDERPEPEIIILRDTIYLSDEYQLQIRL